MYTLPAKCRFGFAAWIATLSAAGLIWTTATVVANEELESSGHTERISLDLAEHAAELLPPGGNTIGGPGVFDGEPGVGWVYSGLGGRLCVTVMNRGISVVRIITEPQRSFDDLVFANETETRCGWFNSATLTCEGGADVCKAFWRLDYLPKPQ